MKLRIITSDTKVLHWKTLDSKLDAIRSALPSFTVSIQHEVFIPKVVDGRIDHTWSDNFKKPFFNQGFDIIGLHFTDADRTKFGLKPSLRGSNPNTKQEWGDFWFWANENTKREGLNQFVQTCLHELAHEYHQQTKTEDFVHTWHDTYPDIIPYIKTLDWSKYQPRRTQLKAVRNLLQRIVGLLKAQQADKPNQTIPTKLTPLVERLAANIVTEMKAKGHEVRVVQGYRSIEEQNKLYGQGRTTPGAVVTNAKGGESYHNYGVAVDFVFRKEGYNAAEALWQLLGKVGKQQGFEWGGDWKGFVDRPHFELRRGYNLRDFQLGKVDYNKYK